MSNVYGYIRVSTREQNEDRQLTALRETAVPERYAKIMYNLAARDISLFGHKRSKESKPIKLVMRNKRLQKVRRENDIRVERYQKEANGSGQIPAGKYTAIKYVFKNHFECKGQVTLRDEVYGSTGVLNGGPVFKKGQQSAVFAYDYGNYDGNWEWCKVNAVAGGDLEVTEFGDFTLDETSTKVYNVNVTLAFLWCGRDGDLTAWRNFDESSYVISSNSWVDTDHFALSTDKNTLIAPFIDPPEMENNF